MPKKLKSYINRKKKIIYKKIFTDSSKVQTPESSTIFIESQVLEKLTQFFDDESFNDINLNTNDYLYGRKIEGVPEYQWDRASSTVDNSKIRCAKLDMPNFSDYKKSSTCDEATNIVSISRLSCNPMIVNTAPFQWNKKAPINVDNSKTSWGKLEIYNIDVNNTHSVIENNPYDTTIHQTFVHQAAVKLNSSGTYNIKQFVNNTPIAINADISGESSYLDINVDYYNPES